MTLIITLKSKNCNPETLCSVLDELLQDDRYSVRQTGKYVCIFNKRDNIDVIRIYNTGKQFIVCMVSGVILYGNVLSADVHNRTIVTGNESKFRKKVLESGKIHL